MEVSLPIELKAEYPFTSHYFKLSPTSRMHYVDEGEGPVVIMLHGNPTWSFYYRHLIKELKTNHRVIVPDHIGCGLSSVDQSFSYQLKDHIENVFQLLTSLKIKTFSLIVHDWGGAIGFGLALKNPSMVEKIVALNTAAFTSSEIPFRINILRNPIGEIFIRTFNGFAGPATFMAVEKPMSALIKKGFTFPYSNYQRRLATAKFVRDIPMTKNHPSFQTLKSIEDRLPEIQSPLLLLWGEKDFCFTMNYFHRFKNYFPKAKSKTYPNAGHYVLEDEKDDVIAAVKAFLA